jgi:hypothetical protein
MNKEYLKIASVPKDEKIVACISYGGFYYWSWKYPFYHYKEHRYLVATEKAIYEIIYPLPQVI